MGSACGLFASAHQIGLDELVQIAVQYGLRVGSLVAGAMVLDELVRVERVAAYLRSPLDLLFLTLQLVLQLHAFLEFPLVEL